MIYDIKLTLSLIKNISYVTDYPVNIYILPLKNFYNSVIISENISPINSTQSYREVSSYKKPIKY